RTMDVRDFLQSLLENKPDDISEDEFMEVFRTRFQDIESLIKNNKMIDSDENLYLEFGFEVNNKKGRYILEMDEKEIVYEFLEYVLLKNRGICFKVSKEKFFLSEKVFLNKDFSDDLKIMIKKFWGKHSLLGILNHDIFDKTNKYYEDKISENMKNVLSFLRKVSCQVKYGNTQEKGVIGLPKNFLGDYYSGKVDLNEEKILDNAEKMLNFFLTTLYQDIQSVYYKREIINDKIKYNLIIRKRIYGKIRDLDFKLESTGTMSVVRFLPFMLITVKGSVAIIDEFDTGIHDVLVKSLITSLNDDIEGQLIMTTHNTLLMESELPKEVFYTIEEISELDKRIDCILKYDNKININTNIRNQYIHGKYRGIPENVTIDFKKLTEML
uniref:AAA family ATPase n=1 Tax=Thomasclavelia spiroformis TaxID=29348 RepID=UPI0026DC85E5